MHKRKMKKGFTLIELIVVIIIVGILASVGLTQYTKVVEKGRGVEARMILGSLRTAQIAENMESGTYKTVDGLGVDAPTTAASSHYFTYSCSATTGTCTATRDGTKTPTYATAYTKSLTVGGVWDGTPGY